MLSSSGAHAPIAPAPALWALEDLSPEGAVFRSTEAEPAHDLEAIQREAYERGFEDGRRHGEAQEAARLEPLARALNDALLTLQEEADHWVGNAQENICAVAMAVARQLVGRELQSDASGVEDLVRQALAEFPLDQPVIVRLNPADLAALTAMQLHAEGRAAPLGADRPEVQWTADPRVTRGGCVLEGRDRIIDGRIDTALERLYRRLTQTDA